MPVCDAASGRTPFFLTLDERQKAHVFPMDEPLLGRTGLRSNMAAELLSLPAGVSKRLGCSASAAVIRVTTVVP